MTTRKGLFHERTLYSTSDQTAIHASHYASEMPEPRNLENLSGPERCLMHSRHIAKRAVDLDGRPVLGRYPVDMTVRAPAEIIEARLQAAHDVIQSWMDVRELDKLAQLTENSVYQGEEVTFLHRTSITGGSERHNFLFTEYESAVIDYLEQSLSHKKLSFSRLTIPVATIPKRTESNPLERLVRQPYIDEYTQQTITGKKIILLDDHVQAGGTFATFFALIKQLGLGTTLIGMTALTIHPTATDLRISDQVMQALLAACSRNGLHSSSQISKLNAILGKVGLSIETLTNREALYLIGLLIDGNDPKARKTYFDLIRSISRGINVPENSVDDFQQLAQSPAVSLVKLTQGMDLLIKERNQEIRARLNAVLK